CTAGDLLVGVADNGFDTTNDVDLTRTQNLTAVQGNDFACGLEGSCADVDVHARTGGNSEDFGTTGLMGDPSMTTGPISATTDVVNNGNINLYGTGTVPTGSVFPFPSSSSWNLWWTSMNQWMGM